LASFRSLVAGCVAAAACSALAPSSSRAATPLEALRFAPDITVSLGGAAISPAGVAEDDFAGNVAPLDVGNLPSGAHVDAYHLEPGGDQLLSFDTTVSLPGSVVAGPADVVRFDGAAYTIAFDAAANDLPGDVNVDAVALGPGGLLLSFDISVRLEGTTFEDEDVVQFVGGSPAFEASFTGADGARSAVRSALGIEMVGPADLLESPNIAIPKPLSRTKSSRCVIQKGVTGPGSGIASSKYGKWSGP
jgi:hypothetical protein